MKNCKYKKMKHLAWFIALAIILAPEMDAQKKKETSAKSDSLKSITFS